MDTLDTNHRRKEDAPLYRNLQSVRTVIEGLILIGIVWIAATQTQQGKDIVEIKTTNKYVEKLADQIPDLSTRIRVNEQKIEKIDKIENRVTDLEAFKKVKE
jgi:hypothetical protein